MKKFVFIPSREDSLSAALTNFFKRAGFTINLLSKCSSIFEAFSKGISDNNVKAEDIVIFCHDDIEILTNTEDFNLFIENELDKEDTGFLGVAGTKLLKQSAVWWEDVNKPPGPLNPLTGSVFHGTKLSMSFNYYGQFGEAVVLDGLFLCAKGKTLNTINLKKPSVFSGDWDFYDIYYTTQTHLKGLKNKTIPIQIVHQSIGELAGRESWHANREAYIRKYFDKLPLSVVT